MKIWFRGSFGRQHLMRFTQLKSCFELLSWRYRRSPRALYGVQGNPATYADTLAKAIIEHDHIYSEHWTWLYLFRPSWPRKPVKPRILTDQLCVVLLQHRFCDPEAAAVFPLCWHDVSTFQFTDFSKLYPGKGAKGKLLVRVDVHF